MTLPKQKPQPAPLILDFARDLADHLISTNALRQGVDGMLHDAKAALTFELIKLVEARKAELA